MKLSDVNEGVSSLYRKKQRRGEVCLWGLGKPNSAADQIGDLGH